jgi:hypothetical protein
MDARICENNREVSKYWKTIYVSYSTKRHSLFVHVDVSVGAFENKFRF